VAVGDVVCCYARCIKTGNSSITINVEVWVKKVSSEPIGQRYIATEAVFTYVAVDDQGKSRQLPEGRSNFSVETAGSLDD
jgi:acyl-CoA thioesterase YciA